MWRLLNTVTFSEKSLQFSDSLDLIELETKTEVISYPGKHVYTQLACHIVELLKNLRIIWGYPCFI